MKVLLIVDVQYDFCPGGSLPVTDGDKIIPVINKIQDKFDLVVATQDWHPEEHFSFASTHDKHPFEVLEYGKDGLQILWPDHCVQGSVGARLHGDLDTNKINMILRKGMDVNVDSYSAFQDNNGEVMTGLLEYLEAFHIEEVYVCGLAADYCVNVTAMDSIDNKFKTFIIEDATKPVDVEAYENGVKPRLKSIGCNFITSEDL